MLLFYGKMHSVYADSNIFAKKAVFSIQFFRVKTLDYNAVNSDIFTTGLCAYMCKGFHQVQASGFCTQPEQPKGINLGIFC